MGNIEWIGKYYHCHNCSDYSICIALICDYHLEAVIICHGYFLSSMLNVIIHCTIQQHFNNGTNLTNRRFYQSKERWRRTVWTALKFRMELNGYKIWMVL